MRGIRKRGDAEGGVIIASIFLLVVILLFVAVFKVAVKPGKEIIGAVENSDKTILLINALRTDIEDGKDIADLIVDGYENRNFDKAKEELSKVLDKAYEGRVVKGFVVVRLKSDDKVVVSSDFMISEKFLVGKPIESGERVPVDIANIPVDGEHYMEAMLYEL